jgi:hypothetical protein
MPTASRPTFMLRFAGVKRAPRPLELADMGTAYGLDQAIESSGDGGPDDPLRPRPVIPVAPWRIWLGRKLGGA